MPSISVERTIGTTKKAVLGGLIRSCGYREFGSIDGYPEGVTRHWFTRLL
jgi:hypothetical protein